MVITVLELLFKNWNRYVVITFGDTKSLPSLPPPFLQTDNPNSFHCYQTAERIREVHPDKDWFHLTGLIHDVGKVLAVWGEPQFTVVGDTFPVGCAFSPKCVFPTLFKENPDSSDPRYK